jgi:hypothetical protein
MMNKMKLNKMTKIQKKQREVVRREPRPSRPTIPAPKIKPKPDGSVQVTRTEYISAILSADMLSSQFSNKMYSINPGLELFPWLSQVADNWSKYRFKRIRFHYKPVVSSANLTGAMGSILLAFNVNAADDKFESFGEMVEYSGSIEKRLCDEIWFSLDTKGIGSNDGSLFVRTGDVDGQDIKTYDLGTLQIAQDHVSTSAYPEGTLLGHLYVEYDVELIRPRVRSPNTLAYKPKFAILRSTATWASDFDMVSYADVLNSNTLDIQLVNIAGVPSGATGFQVQFPTLTPAAYHITLYATTSNTMYLEFGSGINTLGISNVSGDQAYFSFVDGGSPTNVMFTEALTTTGEANAYIQFTWNYTAHFGYYIVVNQISTSPNVAWSQYA